MSSTGQVNVLHSRDHLVSFPHISRQVLEWASLSLWWWLDCVCILLTGSWTPPKICVSYLNPISVVAINVRHDSSTVHEIVLCLCKQICGISCSKNQILLIVHVFDNYLCWSNELKWSSAMNVDPCLLDPLLNYLNLNWLAKYLKLGYLFISLQCHRYGIVWLLWVVALS